MLIGVSTKSSIRQKLEIAQAEAENLRLKKGIAWRAMDDSDVQGNFIVLNWDDPEEAQFFMSISGVCKKYRIKCALQPRVRYPALFPPPGLLTLAMPSANPAFVKAFEDAGLVTGKIGALVGTELFPKGINQGLIIGPKPSWLGSEAWRTNTPPS